MEVTCKFNFRLTNIPWVHTKFKTISSWRDQNQQGSILKKCKVSALRFEKELQRKKSGKNIHQSENR